MNDLSLQAQARSLHGKKTKSLRTTGLLPAVLYGHGVSARSLSLASNEFSRIYRTAGETTLVNLTVDQESPVKVIIQDVQRHPVTGQLIHVDLHQVRMTEKLNAEIPLEFVGEAPAVKELGGVLVKSLSEIKVEALPGDLIHEIQVDVSALKTFEDFVYVKDLRIPKTITVLENPEEVVAVVTPPRSQEELDALKKPVDEKAAVEQVEGVAKKEEEPAEPEAEAGEHSDQAKT